MHYCKNRGKTECCFENEMCETDWFTINDKVRINITRSKYTYSHLFKMTNRSYNFLTKNKEFLDNWVKLGHDTCHKIQGYDAEKCHKDCKKLEKSDFAKECKKDGGLFKCCIR